MFKIHENLEVFAHWRMVLYDLIVAKQLTLHDIIFFLVDLTWGRAPGAPPYKKASKVHFWGQINQ